MSGNKALLAKADMALADISSAGLLNPEQADTFIRKLLVQPVMLSQVRRVVMNAPSRKVNKISFASRIMRSASADAPSGTSGLAVGNRAKPTTEQIQLNTKEVIATVYLPYDVIEDNIERGGIGARTDVGGVAVGGGIVDTIMALIAERAAVDLEELALFGDTAVVGTDSYLGLLDGWLKKLSGAQVLDAGSAPISRRILTDGMKQMLSQYRRNRAGLAHFVSTEAEIDYRETIAQRETVVGDSQTQQTSTVYAAGSPVVGVGQLAGTNKGILTNPLNLLFGIQRQISIETDKDIEKRVYIIVLTARIDFQIEETLAAVKYLNMI